MPLHSLPSLLEQICMEEAFLRFVPYKLGDKLVEYFAFEDWKQIMPSIEDELSWQQHWLSTRDVCACYFIEDKQTNERIGFFCLYLLSSNPCSVAYHGGGWHRDGLDRVYYWRSTIYILENLLLRGIKVQTGCFKSNLYALRYLRALGFRPYQHTKERLHLALSLKWLQASPLYARYSHTLT